MTNFKKYFCGIRGTVAGLLLVLTAASQGISYWSAHDLIKNTLHEREIDKIMTIGNVVQSLIMQHSQRVVQIARLLAVDKGNILSQFILNTNHPTDLAPFLDGVARDAGIDILEITDDKEIILYRANQPARRGDRAKTWGVFEALAGSSQLVTSVDARNIAIRAIEPLRVSGKIVGSLSAGVLINDDFIKSLSRDVRADVALLTRSGGVINTSAALAANLDQKAIDSAFERKIPIYTEQISTHHTVVFWPLLIVDQAYVVAIQLDSSSSFQLLERGSRLSASYAGLMLITVLFIGIF
ncbi:MAG: cache domain-containing protein, partial [Rhodospirillaceae bacterium]